MVDNLPLIPGKGAPCSDVRAVLRTVFREYDYLPPLSVGTQLPEGTELKAAGDQTLPDDNYWTNEYDTECKQICDREDEIKRLHAKRIAREPLPNIFKLHEPTSDKPIPTLSLDRGLLHRQDLTPALEQNAGRDVTLWVKNILNVSSGDVSDPKIKSLQVSKTSTVRSNPSEAYSLQTLSIGRTRPRPSFPVPPRPPPPESPDHVICVPPEIDFINCTVGQLYVQCIRLINVSKFVCRLSVTPPKRPELEVLISSPRGLTITSGARAELSVHFRPMDVGVVKDTLVVRVSSGQIFTIPITCFMQPPILEIAIPSINPRLYSTTERTSLSASLSAADGAVEVLELGARLLGDVHCSRVFLYCGAEHAAFFALTEDAWVNWDLDCVTNRGSVVSDSFVLWPAWWRGGGVVKACAWCRANCVGVHETALRVLSSTAITRQLCLLADVLYFSPNHLDIVGHEKDYDICSDDDPAAHYVHLGSAFPRRALAVDVKLVNCSPIVYTFYWEIRRWGVCSCWEEEVEPIGSFGSEDGSGRLCVGAQYSKRLACEDPETYAKSTKPAPVVSVEPAQDEILPHSTCTLRVHLPDVGEKVGIQRSVLRLILRDIPKESFPDNYEPIILRTTEVPSVPIPGLKNSMQEVCDIVCAEMEVWWEVVPLRFYLIPSVLSLHHSRRVSSIKLAIAACQLMHDDRTCATWDVPARVPRAPPVSISAASPVTTHFELPLPTLPNDLPETDVFTLVAANKEWKSECIITRQCDARHPGLQPVEAWLGVVTPKTRMRTVFSLVNNTYQNISFWCKPFRWLGENPPRPACSGRVPCETCQELACSCALLRPARGSLADSRAVDIFYNVSAPERDGCVATLLQARRVEPDLSLVHDAPCTEARAVLVAYRVLAPRVVIRLRPCGDSGDECADCALDPGQLHSPLGTVTLRPSRALVVGRRTCYRLRVTNITPLPTGVHFDDPIDGTDLLKTTFRPHDFSLRSYGEVEIRVVLAAREVCARRVFVYRAQVARAHKPVYVVVDTAIVGVAVSFQIPIGEGVSTDEFVIMRRTQRPAHNAGKKRAPTPHEIFVEEDQKRAFIKANVCHCHIDMVYLPPVKRPSPPLPEGEYPSVEIVTRPPSFTRVCRCFPYSKPFIPDPPESISLEFINIPLNKVCERRIILRNESVATAHWSTAVRRWPRRHTRTLDTDQWARDVCPPGVALACRPAGGVLAAHAHVEVLVQAYADCWGLYRDQILIQVDKVEPVVLDVWIEVVGAPLQFRVQPDYKPDDLPGIWLSRSDLTRSLVVKNVSRSELLVHAYVTHDIDRVQDALPFRLYFRMYDVLPRTCPCVTACDYVNEEQSIVSSTTSYSVDMDTGIELYLAPDNGLPDDTYYNVSPKECRIKAGESEEWELTLKPPPLPDLAPDATLMLRLRPIEKAGEGWYRAEPLPQLVRLRQAATEPHVRVSCDEVVVSLCVLDLPYGDFLRIRKRFCVLNVGNGKVDLSVQTSYPWCVVQGRPSHRGKGHRCEVGCETLPRHERRDSLVVIHLPPKSSTEVCVEVCISTMEVWPSGGVSPSAACVAPKYTPRRLEATPLFLYDDDQVIRTIPLIVDMEFPEIKIQPEALDFGFVTDGDTRKSYVSVSHTNTFKTLTLVVRWFGSEEFEFWPCFLDVPPYCSERVYIQYTAVWRHGPAEGCLQVSVCSGAGGAGVGGAGGRASAPPGWCRACVAARAQPTRDHRWRSDAHDHTDDERLLPSALRQHYLP